MISESGFAPIEILRLRVAVGGAVQGVGFRPFIYRLAAELHLNGWVENSPQGVCIEVEGEKSLLETFLLRVEREKPPLASLQSIESSYLDPVSYPRFEIRASNHQGERSTLVLPDIATCPDCSIEIFDPANRRYLYPFTNCTHCGPRFSIIQSLPYDRPNTTMKTFEMCAECRFEYENPHDRRFHAQPNACPRCGPQLELWDDAGDVIGMSQRALQLAAERVRGGKIVALKGIGGFHLIVDARNEDAVVRLRQRKRREAKPLAVMFPSLAMIQDECEVSALEERLLNSPESPIVLLKRKLAIENCSLTIDYCSNKTVNSQRSMFNGQSAIAQAVAPNNPYLGAMLPYTPLHHVLMKELCFPIVATSGNVSDEPICIDEKEAVQRLHGIADLFLVHDRPIQRHVDDSVVRVMLGREQVLRRARGYAPLPIRLKHAVPPMLAVGAHQKNTVAVAKGENIFISQHIGDLETKEAVDAFENVAADMQNLLKITPESFVADLHPDYISTQYARRQDLPVAQIQHHVAHVGSCMAENELDGNVLGVSWDGTGFGLDGMIWGGEFFLMNASQFRRTATFREFWLPGGSKAIREPRRTALGLLYSVLGDAVFSMRALAPVAAFTESELKLLHRMLSREINSPKTTSVGRLFDAVASISNLTQRVSFEGEAAMALEFAIQPERKETFYEYHIETSLHDHSLSIIDWSPLIVDIIHDTNIGTPVSSISQKFHNTLVEMLVDIARACQEERIVLTGGCFQNRYLTERAVQRLRHEGFKPYWHQRVPPNDGGISLGQVFLAAKTKSVNGRGGVHQPLVHADPLSDSAH